MDNTKLLDIPTRNNSKLGYREVRFIDEYMITGSTVDSYCIAYNETDRDKASKRGYDLLQRSEVASEIKRRSEELSQKSILSASEILEMYTKIAKGEILDQFGLEASLKDRLSALNELAKRQIDMVARAKQAEDNQLTIKLVR